MPSPSNTVDDSNEKLHEGLANNVGDFNVLADLFSEKGRPGILVLNGRQYKKIKAKIPADNKNILIVFEKSTSTHKLANLAAQAWKDKQLVIYVKRSTLIQNNIEAFIHYFRKSTGVFFLHESKYEQLVKQNENLFKGIIKFTPNMALTPQLLSQIPVLFITNGDPTKIKELVQADLKNRCNSIVNMFSSKDDIVADTFVQILRPYVGITQEGCNPLKDMLATFYEVEEALSPHHFLEKLSQRIYNLSTAQSWVFSGLIGRTSYTLDDGITPIPEGVRNILDILKDSQLSDNDKLVNIISIAKERKGARVASVFNLGLFTRDESTKIFYANLYNEIIQKFPQVEKDEQTDEEAVRIHYRFYFD